MKVIKIILLFCFFGSFGLNSQEHSELTKEQILEALSDQNVLSNLKNRELGSFFEDILPITDSDSGFFIAQLTKVETMVQLFGESHKSPNNYRIRIWIFKRLSGIHIRERWDVFSVDLKDIREVFHPEELPVSIDQLSHKLYVLHLKEKIIDGHFSGYKVTSLKQFLSRHNNQNKTAERNAEWLRHPASLTSTLEKENGNTLDKTLLVDCSNLGRSR